MLSWSLRPAPRPPDGRIMLLNDSWAVPFTLIHLSNPSPIDEMGERDDIDRGEIVGLEVWCERVKDGHSFISVPLSLAPIHSALDLGTKIGERTG